MTERTTVNKRGLGRGLSALFGEDELQEGAGQASVGQGPSHSASTGSRVLPLAQLEPCAFQPRRNFDNQSISELAESLKTHGVLQPLLVRPHPKKPGSFEIVAGERRWRAAQKAKLHELPVVIRELSDRDVLEIGLIENLQRENLTPLEEAETYKKLIDEHAYTQDDLARIIGKSRPHIANMMRLLTLPDAVRAYLLTGKMTAGHARALINASDPVALADRVVKEGLSVRETERLASIAGPAKPDAKKSVKAKVSANIAALETKIANWIGWKVAIKSSKNGSGQIVIPYKNLDQLDVLLRRFGDNTP